MKKPLCTVNPSTIPITNVKVHRIAVANAILLLLAGNVVDVGRHNATSTTPAPTDAAPKNA